MPKTAMIEKGAKKWAESFRYITPKLIRDTAQKVIDANNTFHDDKMMGKETDTYRINRKYADLHALIEVANNKGVY